MKIERLALSPVLLQLQLCDLVEKLNSEIERLGQLNKHTERFAHMYLVGYRKGTTFSVAF